MFCKALDLGYLMTTKHSEPNLKINLFNLTCQICNQKFVTKNEDPTNVLECKPIEFFGIC